MDTYEDKIEDYIDSSVYSSRVVMEFKEQTQEKFHPIDNLMPLDIEEIVMQHVQDILNEYQIRATIIDAALNGSRSRGIEKEDSDLDIVVEIDTVEKEDFLFNILNENDFRIDGIKVDINPITLSETGTLEEYLPAAQKYLEEKIQSELSYGLYTAVKKGDIPKIKEMIQKGADVNYVFRPNEYANTPLHMAAYFADNEAIKILLENGANINCYSTQGKTPLAYAKERHNREETIDLLESHGAFDGTAPIPDFAQVGAVFLSVNNKYLLVLDNCNLAEFELYQTKEILDKRKSLTNMGEEIEIKFKNEEERNLSVYYSFVMTEENMQQASEVPLRNRHVR